VARLERKDWLQRLTPDRPGEVQVATVTGAALVPGMAAMGVRLIRLRRFDREGSQQRDASAMRRLGVLLEILDLEIPTPLLEAAAGPHRRPIPLDSRSGHASDGPVLARWGVRLNIAPEAIREEVRR
jgi:hypothetical protein